ncbi:MAG: DUF362 domain-containing protein [Candidatus Omnitrophota bacterium]
MKSDVYFIKTEPKNPEQKILALKRLLDETKSVFKCKTGEYLPVKLTIGDSTCVYNIPPEHVKCVISHIKAKGAKPFLFDTNVIYTGQRQNAVDHLSLAQNKGFAHSRVGAPFIIADGLFGQDGKEFNINAPNIKKIKVPSFVGMLEGLLVLSHITGHIITGYAGAIKNVAMGICCRSTKQIQHSSLKPVIIAKKCTACECCVAICPVKAISARDKSLVINPEKCLGCGECLCACKFDAISVNWHEDYLIFAKRITEVANFILSKFKNKFFLNFAFDITKECDCISAKDEKMISDDLGILASADILSLEKATADMANKNRKSSFLNDRKNVYGKMLEYAAEIKMGNIEYNLINL